MIINKQVFVGLMLLALPSSTFTMHAVGQTAHSHRAAAAPIDLKSTFILNTTPQKITIQAYTARGALVLTHAVSAGGNVSVKYPSKTKKIVVIFKNGLQHVYENPRGESIVIHKVPTRLAALPGRVILPAQQETKVMAAIPVPAKQESKGATTPSAMPTR